MDQLDNSFADLVLEKGLASREQIDECIEIVEKAKQIGAASTLPDTMVSKGYITANQRDALLAAIKRGDSKTTSIGGYELVEKLGRGGMGVVYKARQTAMDRIVALKLLKPSLSRNEVFVERFFREARTAAKLNHPHIVLAIDCGFSEGYHYFVMEFVDGPTVAERLKQIGKFSEQEALKIAHDVAKALAHAEQHGIVHRDIKPENVMLTSDGTAKLADLGLARSYTTDSSVTVEGNTLGTPYYMSPEQARGDTNLDTRSDIYSLGATLYHMVTGRVPFDGETPAVVVSKRLTEPVPNPQQVRPDLSPATNRLIRRMMTKEPERRFQTSQGLLEGIEAAMRGEVLRTDTPLEALPPAARHYAAAPPKSNKAALLAGVGLAALLAVVIAVVAITRKPVGPVVDPAKVQFDAAADYYAQNPADFDGARAKFHEVLTKFQNTPYRQQSAAKIEEIERAKAEHGIKALVEKLRTEVRALAKEDKFGEALKKIEAFAKANAKVLPAGTADAMIAEVMGAAEGRVMALSNEATDAIGRNELDKAKEILGKVNTFGLPVPEKVKEKLAEIEAREKNAADMAKWDDISKRADELAEAEKFDEALELLATAKQLKLDAVDKMVGEQVEAVEAARKAAEEAREAAKAEAAAAFRAAFNETVKPLLLEHDYAKAEEELEALAKAEETQEAVAEIDLARKTVKRLAAFSRTAEQAMASVPEGRPLTYEGKQVTFVRCKDGRVTCKGGGAEFPVPLNKLKVKDLFGLLGKDFAKTDEARLQAALVLVFDKKPDYEQAKELAQQASAGPDREQCLALIERASRPSPEDDEKGAEAQFALIEKADAGNAPNLQAIKAAFLAKFGHTQFYNDHIADLAGMKGTGSGSGAPKIDRMALLTEEQKNGLVGFWTFDDVQRGWAKDISGKGNHARKDDNAKFSRRGIRGVALSTELGNFQVPYNPKTFPQDTFSMDMCIYANNLSSRRSSYYYYSYRDPVIVGMALDKWGYVRSNFAGSFALTLDDGCLDFDIYPYSSYYYYPEAAGGVRVQTWYHAAFVVDAQAETFCLYLNGKKVQQRQTTSCYQNPEKEPLLLGGPKQRRFNGLIDEVRLWSIALTEQDLNGFVADYGLSNAVAGDPAGNTRKLLANRVTLKASAMPLQNVIVWICNQVGAPYQWDKTSEALGTLATKPVDASFDGVPASDALKSVLAPLNLNFDVDADGGVVVAPAGFSFTRKKLDQPVTLKQPYPRTSPGGSSTQIRALDAIMSILKQAGIQLDQEASRPAEMAYNRYIQPLIEKRPCREALQQIVDMAGMTYEIVNEKVVLRRK